MSLWRSLVFWGGLWVMGFVGWAWRDSLSATSAGGHTWLHVMNHSSRVSFFHESAPIGSTGWGGYRTPSRLYPAMYGGGMGFEREWHAGSGRKLGFWISHDLLLIGTAIAWAGCFWWLSWRSRQVI